ncbi:MAG: hypothetical protein JXR22_13105 [Prolixibacteraceae bacterium]|nr:hypothetical protein [Prolixibacteraceae bacterium]
MTVNTNFSNQQIGIAVSDHLGIFATNTSKNYREPLFYTSESELKSNHQSHWSSIGIVPFLKGRENIFVSLPIGIGKGMQHSDYDVRNDEHFFTNYYNTHSKFLTLQPSISYLIDNRYYLSFFNRSYFSHSKMIKSDYRQTLGRHSAYEYTYQKQTLFNFINQVGANIKLNKNKFDFYFELSYVLFSRPDHFFRNANQYDIIGDHLKGEFGFTYNFNILEKRIWRRKARTSQ